jgi:subtilisin-like proprotein convertase family protein
MKNVKMHFFAVMAATSLAAMVSTGCNRGSDLECADGAVEKDGACVAEATCGEGTVVMNGSCVPQAPECGEGTVLSSSTNTCVPTRDACAEGTSFDGATDSCVPDTEVTCGDGTVAQGNTCIPSDLACGAGTQFVDGVCVVAAAACGPKTQLDANNGSCVATDEVCGDRTAFTGGSCLPTDEVCDLGTVFNDGMGVCLPEASCREGDVVLDGQCVRPIVERAANPDLSESENNDPALGGIANVLDLSGVMEGDTFSVTGTITPPIDLDGDSNVDQDVDVFRIAAEAGQYYRVTVEPVRDSIPMSFEVAGVVGTDTEDYLRQAPHGTRRASSRQFVATATGNYDVRIAPTVTFTDDTVPPLGSDDAEYIVTVERLAVTAVDLDTSATPSVTGSLYALKDNLYKITDLTGGERVTIDANALGANVRDARVFVWSSPSVLVDSLPLGANTQAAFDLPTPTAYISFDWINGGGPDMSYDVSIAERVLRSDLGTLAANMTTTSSPATLFEDEFFTYNFTVPGGEVLRIRQTNDSGEPLGIAIYDAANTEIFSSSDFFAFGPNDEGDFYRVIPGTMDESYRVVLTNNAGVGSIDGVTLDLETTTPSDLGTAAPGGMIAVANTGALVDGELRFYRFNLSDNVTLSGEVIGDDVSFAIFDMSTKDLLFSGATADGAFANRVLPAGDFLFVIAAGADVPAGAEGTLNFAAGPDFEVEPNNDAMTATVISDFSKSYAGVTHSFETGMLSDPDYFSFNVASASIFNIQGTSFQTNPNAVSQCFAFRIEDDAGNVILNDESGNDVFDEDVYLQPGDYYLVMTGWCSSTDTLINYTFGLSLTPPTFEGIDTEPNDMANTAQSVTGVPVPFDIAGGIDSATDEDWYLIDLPAGVFFLELRPLPGYQAPHPGLTIETFDSSGTTQLGTSLLITDVPGSFLVKVSGYDMTDVNGYLIHVDTAPGEGEIEPNNDSSTPQTVGGGNLPFLLYGEIESALDEDWISVSVMKGGLQLILDARPDGGLPNSSMKVDVFDATGTTLIGSGSSEIPAAGTYLLRISGFSSSGENRYALSGEFFPYFASPELAVPDDDPAGTSTTLTVDAGDTCVIAGLELYLNITHTYRGDLNITLTSPGGVSVLVLASSFDGTADYIGLVPSEITPDNPLTPFTGQALAGTWTMELEDTFFGDTGTLHSWALIPTCQ